MKRDVTIAREGSIAMAGFAFGQLFRFGYNFAAARLLGAEALGTYALVVAVMQVGEVVAVGGFDAGLLRFVSQREGEKRKSIIASAMKRSVLASMLAGVLVLLFSGDVAGLLHGGWLMQLALCSAALALPLSVMTIMAGVTMQAHHNLLPKVLATQVIQPVLLVLTMVAARYALGVSAALALPFLLAPLAALVWILPGFRQVTGIGLSDVCRAYGNRELWQFSLPLLAVALFSILSHWIDVVMLGFLTDVRTVGLYQSAARTAGLLRSVLLAFSGIAAPIIAGYHGRQENTGIRETYETVNRWIVMLVMVPFLLLVLFPDEVLSVFGKGFGAGSTALVLLAVTSLLYASFGLGNTVLAMSGGERLSMMNQAGALLLQTLLHWLLIPRFGLNGAAFSTLAVMALLTIVRMAELRSQLGIPALSGKLWKPLAAGIAVGAIMLAIRYGASSLPPLMLLAVAGVAGGFVYILLIRALRLEREEMEVILNFMPFLKRQRTNAAP
ncbi:MAG TPA: sugar transporter [Chlorobaculum sp.]|uniref:Polysaccharide efflux transporter, putative n=1 Tax=Chlorobaculum tepidum (strain ATCC 49652 / DSM 12025 / NBRC 103806 / TLS) TaxID=194439 RepID=Q8KAF6_CHLTE|nr:polysaccharide biosynthesis C-terminal domain-containing protein [Chlorobaculum tepidum]AAM73422.1 polysaccharide efflux transporter, putative [Chlorobaculum tepidum TLS]HBU23199.1 sugar transporter [Chlorobaculum sp.]